jgi:subtilisin-like proprotein convertase family protein
VVRGLLVGDSINAQHFRIVVVDDNLLRHFDVVIGIVLNILDDGSIGLISRAESRAILSKLRS